jgi:hypothetical protein
MRCEVCRKGTDKLSMRDSDGKWVCMGCVPKKEVEQLARGRAQARAEGRA